nr:MAG TPA: hypothetical protein [Caudoviricetes sp.]
MPLQSSLVPLLKPLCSFSFFIYCFLFVIFTASFTTEPIMKYKIRVQVVEYSDDTQRDEYKRDLQSFARIAHIETLKELLIPGMDCFEVDLDTLPEHTQLEYLQALNILRVRNPHYIVELRDSEGTVYF